METVRDRGLMVIYIFSSMSQIHRCSMLRLAALLLLCFSLVMVSSITVNVDMLEDTVGSISDCNPSAGLCNLRSAWEFCSSLPDSNCTINLEENSFHTFNASYGQLELQSDASIEVTGNGATVSLLSNRGLEGLRMRRLDESAPAHQFRQQELGYDLNYTLLATNFEALDNVTGPVDPLTTIFTAADFPITMINFADSDFAQSLYYTACVDACPNDQLIFSSCEFNQQADTIFRLFQGSEEITYSDDSCGSASYIDYTVPPEEECQEYCVHLGCYAYSPCGTTVSFTHIVAYVPPPEAITGSRLIYYEHDPASPHVPTLTLRDLTMEFFGDAQLSGGAVFLDGPITLSIDSCTFVEPVGNLGGALHVTENPLSTAVTGTTFRFAQAKEGGAIYVGRHTASMVVTGSIFQDCNSTDSRSGGAIFVKSDNFNVSISSCEFTRCTASRGGAIAFRENNDNAAITDCTFTDCSAGMGGALHFEAFNEGVIIQNSQFTNCRAENGSALYLNENNNFGRIIESTFTDCTAKIDGGAVLLMLANKFFEVQNSTFHRCTASTHGGAVMLLTSNDDFVMTNTSVSSCSAVNAQNDAGDGGGLWLGYNNQRVVVENSRFTDCFSAGYGGGIVLISFNSGFRVQNTVFTACSAAQGGGLAVYRSNEMTEVIDVVFERCTAVEVGGGAYYQSDNGGALLSGVAFHDCTSESYGGGVGIMKSNNNAILRNLNVTGCSAGARGGGIVLLQQNYAVKLQNVFITSCQAVRGGGLLVDSGHQSFSAQQLHIADCTADEGGGIAFGKSNWFATIRDSTISNCHGYVGGGGCLMIDSQNSDLALHNVHMTSCTAAYGGGIYAETNDNIILRNSSIQHCEADISGGGVYLHGANSNFTLYVTTVANCRANSLNGGGVYSGRLNEDLTIVSSDISDNYAENNGGAIFVESGNPLFYLLDIRTYDGRRVVNSNHPYQFTQSLDTVHVDGAQAYYAYFSEITRIAAQDTIRIKKVNGDVIWSSVDGNWPGINMPALLITEARFLVEFECFTDEYNPQVTTDDNYYGFRLYSVSIFADAGTYPTRISRNRATGDGGGLYMFSSVTLPISMYTKFTNNTASNGGGAYLRIAVVAMIMHATEFSENKAISGNGGGVAVSSGCQALQFIQCNFTSNHADGSGGAASFTTNNGNPGGWDMGNENFFRECLFLQNSAETSGGALYLDLDNKLIVTNSTFLRSVSGGDGGAIMLSDRNTLYLTASYLGGNSAYVCGGAVTEETENQLHLSHTTIADNAANQFGGGLCIKTRSYLSLTHSIVESNQAGIGGGAIACFDSLFPVSVASVLDGNIASSGSALYLNGLSLVSDAMRLSNITIRNNIAVAGTVYFVAGSMEEPVVRNPDVIYSDNAASFGAIVATQAVHMEVPSSIDLQAYGAVLDPPIEVRLIDAFSEYVLADSPVSVTVSLKDPSAEQCGGRFPYLSGTDASADGVIFVHGVATLSTVEVSCNPGGHVTLLLTAALADLASDVAASQRTVTAELDLTLRACVAGETIVSGKCVPCPAGSYSLDTNVTDATTCTECLSLGTVDSCYADQIFLADGYWRRYPTSEAIIPCLDELSGCGGGNYTGDASCVLGYEGPLCSLCSEGYYRSDKKCIPCVDQGRMSPAAVFFTTIGCAGMFIAAGYLLMKMQNDGVTFFAVLFVVIVNVAAWFKKEIRDVKVQLKIVITTFQICSTIPVSMTVAFPPQFARYLSAMTVFNLNVMSVVPVDCANSGGYTFIDKLVMITLAPIGLSLLLLLACTVEYSFRSLVYSKTRTDEVTQEVLDEQEKKLSKVVARYLTLFFLLTYLVLPFIATTIFRTFLCTDLDPENEDSDAADLYLTADMRISCTSDYYKSGVGYAAVMIVVYVIGIPSMYLFLLYRSRKEIMERFQPLTATPQMAAHELELKSSVDQEKDGEALAPARQGEDTNNPRPQTNGTADQENQLLLRHDHAARDALMVSFLYEAYEPQYWYWEVVETTRRLMLTAVLSVCGAGTSAQALFAILLALMYIKLYGFYSPYTKVTDDIVAETGQFQIFLSFLGALVYQRHLLGSEWNTAVSVALILINTAVFFLFVYFAGTTLYTEVKTADMRHLPRLSGGKTAVKPAAVISSVDLGGGSNGKDLHKVYIVEDNDQMEMMEPRGAGNSAQARAGDASSELYVAEDNNVVEIPPKGSVDLDSERNDYKDTIHANEREEDMVGYLNLRG